MIRDRMPALKEALGDTGADNDGMDEVTLQIGEDGPQADMAQFLAKVSEVRGRLNSMRSCVEQTRRLHGEVLSSSHTDEKVKLQLEDLTAEFKRNATTVKIKISEIAKSCESVDPDNNSASLRMKKTQHSALSRQFVETMTEFNKVQEEYRDRCKGRIQRQLEITGRTTTPEELDEMLEEGNLEVFTKGILKETQQARQQLQDIEERHAEIVKLENSIRELHDLFMDMAVLVESQGELVDSIEKHVCQAQEYVKTAEQQTKSALSYQGKARKKKIMIGICLLVLLIIIILIIVLSV